MTESDDVSLPGDQGMAGDYRLNGLAEQIGVSVPMTSINGYMGLSRESVLSGRFTINGKEMHKVNPLNDYDMLRPHA